MPTQNVDVDGYLRRLGVPRPQSPTAEALRGIHRAHTARVPYENLLIHLGRSGPLDPAATAARIASGGGGYCFEANGAFAALLSELGYEVRRHEGRVWGAQPDPNGQVNHLALTVRCADGSTWFADAGLGDALYEPLPLAPGEYRQGPFAYRMERLPEGGWRFRHAPGGSFAGMDFGADTVDLGGFAAPHHRLSTDPESPFVRVLTIARRDADGVDLLRGLTLSRWDGATRTERQVGDPDAWYELLGGFFGLPVRDIPPDARTALWERVAAAHELWERSRQPAAPPDASAT